MRVKLLMQTLAAAARAWWEDDALRLGASVAYYTLFAIGPVLLVAVSIAGLVFGPEAVRGEIVGQLDGLIGRDGAQAVQALLEGASKRQASIVATIIGTVASLIAATGAFLELQVALNTIWRVKPKPDAYLKALLIDRLRSFGIVVAIGFLLLVSLVITAALAAFSAWISRRVPGFPITLNIMSLLVSLIVTSGLFAMLFKFLPDVKLLWEDVATGSVVTAVLFMIGQQAIGFYLGQSTTTSSYGAAGSVMILLLWVYYSCQILLFGAEFTRLWAARHGVKPRPQKFAEKDPDSVHPKSALG